MGRGKISMEKLARIWASFAGYRIDPDTLSAYRTAIPTTIGVDVKHKNNRYIATVKSIENEMLPKNTLLVTEADSDAKLIDMVNDLVLTYKHVPPMYRPYFKNILKPDEPLANATELTLIKA